MKTISGEFQDVLVVHELRGGYPNVPIASDVDYTALIAGDESPVFLTLPIGKAGVTSGNQRHYDDAWLQELERQTLAGKPVGLMGHLSTADRAHAFPSEAIHWVGAVREGDMLWGKGYVPPGEARQRIQRYKAQGKKIATSIDAYAEGAWDDSLKAYRMDAKSMRLAQIDIAPADRAGVPALAAVPVLTTEMANEPSDQPQETVVDKLTIINEMTADDARLLPEPVRAAIVAAVPVPPEVALVQELRSALGLEAGADIKAHLTALRQAEEAQRQATIRTRVRELVEDTEKGVKIVALRGMVTELIKLRNPATVEAVDAIYTEVVASEPVKAALAAHVQETMGPAQTTSTPPGTGKAPKYYSIPKAA